MNSSPFQNMIESIESLSIEDQDYLFDLIRKRRIEKRRQEIANNAKEAIKAVELETSEKGTFWDSLQECRQIIESENIVFTDEDFANLKDSI